VVTGEKNRVFIEKRREREEIPHRQKKSGRSRESAGQASGRFRKERFWGEGGGVTERKKPWNFPWKRKNKNTDKTKFCAGARQPGNQRSCARRVQKHERMGRIMSREKRGKEHTARGGWLWGEERRVQTNV